MRRSLIAPLALGFAALTSSCGGSGGGSTFTPAPPGTSINDPEPPPPPAPAPQPGPDPAPDCETRGEYTLCVTLQDPRVNAATVSHLEERFFDVYPRLAERFNRGSPASVSFVIGPASFIAGASGDSVTYQAQWLVDHPQDYDVVVHEVMHLVQNYTSSPGWLTEGIADYVRNEYGVNNAAAGWQLRPPASGESHTDGYGTTARFLLWVEQRYAVELVDLLDAAIRGGSYDATLWISYTGKSVDQLWYEYLADPALAPS